MRRIAIIGGGIAGLSAAWRLEQARQGGAGLEWTLFEKSSRLGGVIRTERHDGFVLEAGPDSFLTMKPDAARLCRELGLADELISSNDQERKTYILVKGRLVPIPQGLEFMVPTRIWPMAATPLFSFRTKLRMAAELFSSRNQAGDEPVSAFVRRHFGQEMVDRVAEPLLAGVYGGSAERLSVRAVLPRFAEMERESGSLVRATLRAKARARASAHPEARPQPLFTSLKNGMQQMVDALVSALPKSASADRAWSPDQSKRSDSMRLHPSAPTVDSSMFSNSSAEANASLPPFQRVSRSARCGATYWTYSSTTSQASSSEPSSSRARRKAEGAHAL